IVREKRSPWRRLPRLPCCQSVGDLLPRRCGNASALASGRARLDLERDGRDCGDLVLPLERLRPFELASGDLGAKSSTLFAPFCLGLWLPGGSLPAVRPAEPILNFRRGLG